MAQTGLVRGLLNAVGTASSANSIRDGALSVYQSSMYLELREQLRLLGTSGSVTSETKTLDNGCYRQLTLSNPSSRNAMTGSMIVQFGDAIFKYLTGHDNAIVVKGDRSAFCAGSHLDLLQAATASDRAIMCDYMQFVSSALWLDSRPVITYAQRAAVGGGCELFTVCLYSYSTRPPRQAVYTCRWVTYAGQARTVCFSLCMRNEA
jgi:hypothetical protein